MQIPSGFGCGEEARKTSGLATQNAALLRMLGLMRRTHSSGFLKLTGAFVLILACVVNCLAQQSESPRQSALALEKEGNAAEAEAVWKTLLSSKPNYWEDYAHLGLLEARHQ